MLKMEMNRIGKRPIFWLLILAGLVIALIPVIKTWPHGVTSDYYVFYPRSAYVSWMPFGTDLYYVYTLIFPLLASLSYSDAYAEDFNTGLIKGILTKVEKKRYILIRYAVNFCVGGLVAVFPLIINLLGEMMAFPLIENNFYYGMILVKEGSFLPDLFYHHSLIYIILKVIILFLFGGMLASLGLALSTVVKNRYVVLIFPFLVFIGLDVVVSSINPEYSIYTQFLGNIKVNSGLPLYLLVGIIGSFMWFYIAGDKNETI